MYARISVVVVLGALALALLYPMVFQKELPLATTINATYDFIIVGGGSAGSVLAGRLSEDENVSVLVLEAGQSDWNNQLIDIPAMAVATYGSDIDWAYVPEHQDGMFRGFKNERSQWIAGKVLGGSGSINAMLAVRGNRHDYDRWASYTGDQTWDYRHVLPYFKRMENMQVPGLRDSEYHGKEGPLVIDHMNPSALAEKIVEAGRDLGFSNDDYNGKSMEGFFHNQNYRANNRRLTSSGAYLHPAMDRTNLDVAVNALVQRVVIKDKRAVGVEVIRNGRKQTVNANKEVIISAGAIQSPHILLLSGIGPKKQLVAHHIPVVADLPVGENLQDHILIQTAIGISEPISHLIENLSSIWTIINYYLFGKGLWNVPNFAETLSFQSVTAESKEIDWPDLELHFTSLAITSDLMNYFPYQKELVEEMKYRDDYKHGFSCNPSLIRPESRGNVTLASSDPFDHPLIRPNYLTRQFDIDTLVRGVDACKALVNTTTMQSLGAKFLDTVPLSPCKMHTYGSPEYWSCVLSLGVFTISHQAGTCKMGPKGDPTAVVDSELRVQGVTGLRVVDASIMPWVTSGNTYIPTLLIAEKASDMILGKNPLPPLDNL